MKEKTNVSCLRGDIMEQYFVALHKEILDRKLQSKFGEYAKSSVSVVADEDGGDIKLSFGLYDLRDELVNFSQDVAQRINNSKYYEYNDFTKEEIEKSISQFIEYNNLNVDIDWEEDKKSILLFYNDKNYKTMTISNECDTCNFMILEELYSSIENFIDETMKTSIKQFNEAWVYNYSFNEDILD